MTTASVNSQVTADPAPLGIPSACWYAARTRPRHEKSVARQLTDRNLISFVPLYRSVRRWKDRQKELQLPLFPGYCFVQMLLDQRLRVLQVPGVIDLVSFQGRPALVPDAEIEALRRTLDGVQFRPHPYLRVGRRVRIEHGPMGGIEGFFVRRKDRTRVVISISLIQRSVAVEVDEGDVAIV